VKQTIRVITNASTPGSPFTAAVSTDLHLTPTDEPAEVRYVTLSK